MKPSKWRKWINSEVGEKVFIFAVIWVPLTILIWIAGAWGGVDAPFVAAGIAFLPAFLVYSFVNWITMDRRKDGTDYDAYYRKLYGRPERKQTKKPPKD